jgi:ribosome-interacting GTPase 1
MTNKQQTFRSIFLDKLTNSDSDKKEQYKFSNCEPFLSILYYNDRENF